jgi:hypothetical protein
MHYVLYTGMSQRTTRDIITPYIVPARQMKINENELSLEIDRLLQAHRPLLDLKDFGN